MKLRLSLSEILVAGAIALMVGPAVVRVPANGNGETGYPIGPSMMVTIVGALEAMSVWLAVGRHIPRRHSPPSVARRRPEVER